MNIPRALSLLGILALAPAASRPPQPPPAATWGSDVLALLPEGEDKRRFILDCTGCHRMDLERAFPGGQSRDAAGWQASVDRMLGFAGATTGFPVISSDRHGVVTGAWLQQHWKSPGAAVPYRLTSPARAGAAEFTTYLLDAPNDLPHDIAVDSAGRIVVTGMMTHQMLVLDPATKAWTNVPIPVSRANPRAIDVDRAGNWWVALGAPRQVARYDGKDWLVANAGVYAHSVSVAPDGTAWLNGHFSKSPEVIGSVDTVSRTVRMVSLPEHPVMSVDPAGPIPYELRVANDGTVWMSELQGNRLISYDPRTKATRAITMPEPWMGPRRFDVAADGSLWVPAYAANELVHVVPKPDGQATFERFPLPVANVLPYVVRMDPVRGGLWIGTGAGDVVFHFSPSDRAFKAYQLPDAGAIIRHLTIAPRSGDVWLAYGASPGIAARVVRLRPQG